MPRVALKKRVMQGLELLDDEQTLNVITFIESLPKSNRELQNSKNHEEREQAEKAFNELLSFCRPSKHAISLNARDEIVDALWNKYESLN